MIRQALSISNFKKIGKAGTWVLSFVLLFSLVVGLLNHSYVKVDEWSRIMWHSFYQEEKIDAVCLGSSHVYCNLDPAVLDQETGERHFNLGTSNQRVQESYYNLKEANRRFDLKKAYVELYYLPSTGIEGQYDKKANDFVSWRNTDFISPWSPVKYEAIWDMNDSTHLLDATFPFLRFRAHLFEGNYVKARWAQKKTSEYQQYKYHEDFADGNGAVDYQPRGYYASSRILGNDTVFEARRTAQEMTLSEDAKTYLLKIIDYCKKENIELTFFIAPIWQTELLATEGYDQYTASVKNFSRSHHIPFYDFNLCKEEALDLSSADYFHDVGHLNQTGAARFSKFFAATVHANPNKAQELFYDTYQEKQGHSAPQFYGAYLRSSDKDHATTMRLKQEAYQPTWQERIRKGFIAEAPPQVKEVKQERTLYMAVNQPEAMEYQVYYVKTKKAQGKQPEGEKVLVQDFSDVWHLPMPKDDHGLYTIVWRLKAAPSIIHKREIAF